MSIWKLRAEGAAYAPDLGEVRRALEVLPDQSAGVELRSLPAGRSLVLPATDHDQLVSWVATEAGAGARGIYWTLNPIPADLGRPAKVGDVLRRRWMLIDVDPVRPDGQEDESATDDEHREARLTLATLRGWLTDQHWPDPVVIDSGNGWHALYRVDLPNDPASQALLRSCLLALSTRFSGRAKVDCKVHNASRISKLPGTWARKGINTATRPYRMARFAGIPADPQPVPVGMLEELAAQDTARKKATATVPAQPPPVSPSGLKARATSGEAGGWAGAALREEVQAVRTAPAGGRNDRLNTAAFNLGQIVAGGSLAREVVEQALTEAALAAGLGEQETAATIRSGLEAGMQHPRTAPERQATQGASGHANGKATADQEKPLPEVSADDVATIDDLEAAGAQVSWVWPEWIQNGVLTVIAARGGTGKTRLCADLVRRIRHGLPWPDGQEMTLPDSSLALWVVSDNHHDEMVSLARSFGIKDALRLNAPKSDPYAGVLLETMDDLRDLEARVRACRPALVVIDTVGNSTDKNLSKQEDAKAYYFPLQIIARKYRCAVVCLTHLNSNGSVLGRRALEKVRVAIRMDLYPGDDRRRLEVIKSNSKRPESLGVTMTDTGNEYDHTPPVDPEQAGSEPGQAKLPAKVQAAADWLADTLKSGPQRVATVITRAENAGHTKGSIYRARDILKVVESGPKGHVMWELTSDEFRT